MHGIVSLFVEGFVYPFKPQLCYTSPQPSKTQPVFTTPAEELFSPLRCQQLGSFASLPGTERVCGCSRSRRCPAPCFPSCRLLSCKGGSSTPGRRLKSPRGARRPLPCGELGKPPCVLLAPAVQCLQGKFPGAFPTAMTSLALKAEEWETRRRGRLLPEVPLRYFSRPLGDLSSLLG